MRYCHHCGAEVEATASICGECGRDLFEPAADAGADTDADEGGGADPASADGTDSASESSDPTDGASAAAAGSARSTPRTAPIDDDGLSGKLAGIAGRSPHEDEGPLTFALKYPLSGGLRPLLLGGAMILGSVLLAPFLVLMGYCYRLSRSAARGDPRAPPFEDFVELLKDGALFAAVQLPFLLGIAAAVAVAAVVGGVPGAAIAFAAVVALYYLQEAVLTLYVVTGSVAETYDPSRLLAFAGSTEYLLGWLLQIPLAIALALLAIPFGVTVVGALVFAAYANMALGALWGYVYHGAAENGRVPSARAASSAAGTESADAAGGSTAD